MTPEPASSEPRGEQVTKQLADLVGRVRALAPDGRLEYEASAYGDNGAGVAPGVPGAEPAEQLRGRGREPLAHRGQRGVHLRVAPGFEAELVPGDRPLPELAALRAHHARQRM